MILEMDRGRDAGGKEMSHLLEQRDVVFAGAKRRHICWSKEMSYLLEMLEISIFIDAD